MPLSVVVGSLAVEFLCVTMIELVTGSPRHPTYLRTPLRGRVTITVLLFALITAAWTFAFVVNVTLPHAVEVPPWWSWGLIALTAAGAVIARILDVGNTWRTRHTRHTPPGPSPEPAQFML